MAAVWSNQPSGWDICSAVSDDPNAIERALRVCEKRGDNNIRVFEYDAKTGEQKIIDFKRRRLPGDP